MAQEITSLVLAIDSSGVRRAGADLDNFAQRGKKAETAASAVSAAMRSLTTVVSVGSVALLARQALQTADAYNGMAARLSLVTRNTRDLVAAQESLFNVAQRTRIDLQETTTLYTRLASSTEALGVTQSELVGVTESINRALVISGTSAASAQAALVQLGQAFASGVLRGEELNSVLEQAPRLAKAVADGLGRTTGELRQMGANGEITAEKLFRALQASSKSLEDEFKRMPTTVGQAVTQVDNSVTRLIGTLDRLTGTSSSVASWAGQVSASLDRVNSRVAKSGGVWSGYFDALQEGWASARLQATRESMERMAGAVKDARAALAENPKNPYAKDTLREFAELEQAARGYEATMKRVQGVDATKVASGSPGGRQRDISEKTLASVSASMAREKKEFEARAAFLKEYATAEEKFTAALKEEKEKQGALFTADSEKRLRDKFFPKKPKELDFVKGDVGAIQRGLETLTSSYADAERVLEAQRAAGLVSERKYYGEKLLFLELNTSAQVKALEAENAAIEARARKGQKGLDDDRQVADNLAQISILQARAAASAQVMGIEQKSAGERTKIAYEEAERAARSYLDTVARQNARQLEALGLGEKAGRRASERGAIEDKYRAQIDEAMGERRREEITDEALQERLRLLADTQAKEIAMWEKHSSAIEAANSRWQTGASAALRNYADQSASVAEQVSGAITNGFKRAEDSIVDFVMTGKGNFRDFANSVIADFLRIQTRAIMSSAVSQVLGLAAGGGSIGSTTTGGDHKGYFDSLERRAIGGPVSAGSMYQVNERGPELLNVGNKQFLMMGSQGGSVSSNTGMRGGDTNITVAAGPSRNEVMSAIQLAMNAVRAETDTKLRRAGVT